MADPSSQIAPPLLGHLHAVSKCQYATFQNITVDMIGELLLKAPQVAAQFPFTWSMLDTPPEGSLYLVWVPPSLNGGCASDGFVWVDPDQGYSMEWRGYTVEMIQTKSGFIPQQESHTFHTRRRYRLVSKPNSNVPAADPNLWLFHYIRADRANQIDVSQLQLGPGITQTQNTRRQIANLQQQGAIPLKEFYLHDRNSWPVINFGNLNLLTSGRASLPHTPQQARHMSPMAARGSQQGYYPGNAAQASPSPALPSAKRLKPTPSTGTHFATSQPTLQAGPSVPSGVIHDPPLTMDEEEDTSRGDMLDHLTPREISTARYIQHHEWMEEVLGSVYSISKIKPVELGFGLRGELEELSKGLFEPPTFPQQKKGQTSGKEEEQPNLADIIDEFRCRANKKISNIEAEMEKMKAQHKRRLEKIRETAAIKDGERKLRAQINFDLFGNDSSSNGEEAIVEATICQTPASKTEEEIVKAVEELLGKKVAQRDLVIKWEVDGGKHKGLEEDKDEIMSNTAEPQKEEGRQPSEPNKEENTNTPNTNTPNVDNREQVPENEDIDMSQDDTMMEEPTMFDEAFADTGVGADDDGNNDEFGYGENNPDIQSPSDNTIPLTIPTSAPASTPPTTDTLATTSSTSTMENIPPQAHEKPLLVARPENPQIKLPSPTPNSPSNPHPTQPQTDISPPPSDPPSTATADSNPQIPVTTPTPAPTGDGTWSGIPGLGSLPPPHPSLPPKPTGSSNQG